MLWPRLCAALACLPLLTRCSSIGSHPQDGESRLPPRADLVLRGGHIDTLDPAQPEATAVAVLRGRVVALGRDAEVSSWIGADTRVVDLKGRTLLPGLIDSHAHLSELGMSRAGVDLVATRSLEEVRARLRKAVAAAKPDDWIIGRGWDQNDWESFKKRGLKFPTAHDLDDIAPNNPVVLYRIDGHALWANSKAMALAGVDLRTRTRPGGEIVKVKSKPSGVFVDNAMDLILRKTPAPSTEAIRAGILSAQKECLAAGLTQVDDMGIGERELEVLKALDASGTLRLRVYAFLDGSGDDITKLMGQGPIVSEHGDHRLTVRGVKLYADGALGSRGALLLEPYSDERKTSGLAVTPPDVLEARVRAAASAGYQVATHAIGDRANRLVLDIYARVFGPDGGERRPRIEHAQVLAPEDIPRFARGGVIASMQPTHATSDMPWAAQRLGRERVKGAYAWRSLLTRGATIAAGSDAPVEDVSPVPGIYAAVTRKSLLGLPAGGWMPEQRMTPREAVAAFTSAGAYASFRERDAGRIAPGRIADFTVVDKDPLTCSEDELATARAEMTIISGKIEYEKPAARTSTAAVSARGT